MTHPSPTLKEELVTPDLINSVWPKNCDGFPKRLVTTEDMRELVVAALRALETQLSTRLPDRDFIARVYANATSEDGVNDEFWGQIKQASARRRANYPDLWLDDVEKAFRKADAILRASQVALLSSGAATPSPTVGTGELLDAEDLADMDRSAVIVPDRAPTAGEVTEALRDVMAERQRQISAEGWSCIHDDAHAQGELASAAACYAMGERLFRPMNHHNGFPDLQAIWPWDPAWWKPTTTRRNLVKAAALLLAEIERLDRAKSPPQGDGTHGEEN